MNILQNTDFRRAAMWGMGLSAGLLVFSLATGVVVGVLGWVGEEIQEHSAE